MTLEPVDSLVNPYIVTVTSVHGATGCRPKLPSKLFVGRICHQFCHGLSMDKSFQTSRNRHVFPEYGSVEYIYKDNLKCGIDMKNEI